MRENAIFPQRKLAVRSSSSSPQKLPVGSPGISIDGATSGGQKILFQIFYAKYEIWAISETIRKKKSRIKNIQKTKSLLILFPTSTSLFWRLPVTIYISFPHSGTAVVIDYKATMTDLPVYNKIYDGANTKVFGVHKCLFKHKFEWRDAYTILNSNFTPWPFCIEPGAPFRIRHDPLNPI